MVSAEHLVFCFYQIKKKLRAALASICYVQPYLAFCFVFSSFSNTDRQEVWQITITGTLFWP
jgi:hypothetical protein